MANHMVLQTWIIECRKIFKISDKVIKYIIRAIENWKAELAALE